MDINAAKDIGAGLAMSGLIGAGAGLGILFGNYLQAAIRNPAAAAGERSNLFLGMALAESMGLFAFVMGLLIKFT
jgi:F-type H+-transporting ATPase subunit c